MKITFEIAKSIVDIFPVELRDHSYNVCSLSVRLAEYLGYKNYKLKNLAIGSLLHDIGKTGISEKILNKPGKLTEEEYAIVKNHTVIGSKLLKSYKGVESILPAILYHHERWDGAGYEQLKESEIPEAAQIVTIADAFDAMTTNRPYQKTKTLIETLHELNKNKASQFSPALVESFEKCIIDDSKRTTGKLRPDSVFW
ncbi:MAG: HD-GYP domain-containing protein [Desulfocucumaceae bacterium]